MPVDLDRLEQSINYQFRDRGLAALALTHRSAERRNNERLEFLGDAMLGFVVGEALFQRFDQATEGDLSQLRARLVNKFTLAALARDLKLGSQIHLGSGEMKSGGKNRASILADAVEALIGAVYLDSDLETCRAMVLAWYGNHLDAVTLEEVKKDPKTRLQEFLQSKGKSLPVYHVSAIEGEAHDQTFYVECRIAMLPTPTLGEGKTRRLAEQQAAQLALDSLGL